MTDAKARARSQAVNEFLNECRGVAGKFEEVFVTAVRLLGYYEDNDYAADLTIEDFAAYRFEKEDIDQFILMLQQIVKMASGIQPDLLNYRDINNQIK